MPTEMERIAVLESKIVSLEGQVKELKEDRKSLMKWGLLTLGSAVVGLIGYIFSNVPKI